MFEGKAFVFGDNVDTDAIIPACYLNSASDENLRAHCMEFEDPSFAGSVRVGDILVAGANFGCGSSREHAPLALRACGIRLVVAKSFARIFFRNAINIGLPLVESDIIPSETRAGDAFRCDLESGSLVNVTHSKTYTVSEIPPFLQKIVDAGGLLNSIKGDKL